MIRLACLTGFHSITAPMGAIKGLVFTVVLIAFAAIPAKAEVLFTKVGFDLKIDITTPIEFTLLEDYDSNSLYIEFLNVNSVAPLPKEELGTPTPAFVIDGSSPYAVFFGQGTSIEGLTNLDTYAVFSYFSNVTLDSGETLIVPAMSFTSENWFLSGGVLPSKPSKVQLLNQFAISISAPVTVPEPSSVALLGLAALGGHFIRRKKA